MPIVRFMAKARMLFAKMSKKMLNVINATPAISLRGSMLF